MTDTKNATQASLQRADAAEKGLPQSGKKVTSSNLAANIPDLHDTTAILVVDDEKLIRLTVCAKLKKAGYMPIAVGSVDEAVQILKERLGGQALPARWREPLFPDGHNVLPSGVPEGRRSQPDTQVHCRHTNSVAFLARA